VTVGTYHLANVLELIRIFCVDWNMDLKNHPDTLMSIIGFTNISDPWTSTLAYSKANILLSLCGLNSESEMRSQFIINACLTGFLRVLSSSTAPKPLELGKVSHVNYGKLKTISGAHWRDTHPHACSVLSWAMTNSEVGTLIGGVPYKSRLQLHDIPRFSPSSCVATGIYSCRPCSPFWRMPS
jgi:hypothetical protein